MTGRRRSTTSASTTELAARMARVDGEDQAQTTEPPPAAAHPQARNSAATDQHDQPSPRRAEPARPPAVRTRPVRTTVEFSPLEHAKLKTWCAQAAADIGVPLVAGAEVLRALWALMRDDPDLAARVTEQLRQSGGSRRRW